MTFESGVQAMVLMPARCPSSVWESAPVWLSHILMVLSAAVISQCLSHCHLGSNAPHSNLRSIFHPART
jgi:hypothetical protein